MRDQPYHDLVSTSEGLALMTNERQHGDELLKTRNRVGAIMMRFVPRPYMHTVRAVSHAYASGDLEMLRAFEALLDPHGPEDTTEEYVEHLRQLGLTGPLDRYFTHAHVQAFEATYDAIRHAVFSVSDRDLSASYLPVMHAVLEAPDHYQQLLRIIKERGIMDPEPLAGLYREVSNQHGAIMEGAL